MTLQGIDVSNNNGPVDWASYRGKVQFAGIKITEGLSEADDFAKANIAGALSIGAIPVGYHFLHAGQDGAEQCEYFLGHARATGLHAGHLIAVDCEDFGLDGLTGAVMNVVAAQFRAQLQKHFPGYNPWVYTEISMAPQLVSMKDCPLWLADLSAPLLTKCGPWNLVSAWQTGQRGVDADVFNGTAEQLAKLAIPG